MFFEKNGFSGDPFPARAVDEDSDVCGCVGVCAFVVDVDVVDFGGFDGARVGYDVARCEYDGPSDDVDVARVGQDVA